MLYRTRIPRKPSIFIGNLFFDPLIGSPGNDKVFLYFGPITREDLQDRIKVQQEVVRQVEQELIKAKQGLSDARK